MIWQKVEVQNLKPHTKIKSGGFNWYVFKVIEDGHLFVHLIMKVDRTDDPEENYVVRTNVPRCYTYGRDEEVRAWCYDDGDLVINNQLIKRV